MSKTKAQAPEAQTAPMPTAMPAILRSLRKARIVGTPLVSISTFDNAVTIQAVTKALDEPGHGFFEWDIVRGVRGVNATGKKALLSGACGGEGAGQGDLGAVLFAGDAIPENAVLFIHNAHLYFDSALVRQGIWNFRDSFKQDGKMLVLLAPQMTLPPELSNDVLMLDEELPNGDDLRELIRVHYANTRAETPEMPELTDEMVERAVDALTGLAYYPAETAFMLSLVRAGIDFQGLWERKRKMVEQTPGLTIYRGTQGFDDVAGLGNVKDYVGKMVTGNRKPRAVVWVDEIEKQMAGLGSAGGPGDSSGTTQDQLGKLLEWMQNDNVRGLLFVGFPGGGKSLIAKVTGAACGVPTIQMDLGGMKGSLVGQSEENIRRALKVISAVGQEEVLVIATCNSVGNLPPELRRRFKRGTFFFDLPTPEEREAAWLLHSKRHGFEGLNEKTVKAIDFDDGWTGAEIEVCVEQAVEMGLTLEESARFVVPICRSMRGRIEEMRSAASGCFISASHPGIYDLETIRPTKAVKDGGRKSRQLED